MYKSAQAAFQRELDEIRAAGLYKKERVIESSQDAVIVSGGKKVINFCANNYLGLSNNPELIAGAAKGMEKFGFGLSSVRFICGTQTIHKDLEKTISNFFSTEDAILYAACFDANGGLFETILGPDDAVISDSLNHASIIDGVRLCKAKRFVYQHADMADLKSKLEEARNAKAKKVLVATDGVFSMDGDIAKLDEICDLADRFEAMVMIDECHASGFIGKTGRGTPELFGVQDRVDIITSTLGKALGGSAGGFTTGRKEIIELLRQRSRPYLFSNALPPALCAGAMSCFELLNRSTELRDKLEENTAYFRDKISSIGFTVRPGTHPIVPVMLGDAQLASTIADELLEEGIYVIGFSFPVVPKGQARIRVQVSAAHSREHLDQAVQAFKTVGARHGIGA
ncbi:MAG: glycine C-acetyltransferase [Bdellovibrionales bacterium]|nr:glycine C-acetyltransferase [Bdellovibrionales bacterium]